MTPARRDEARKLLSGMAGPGSPLHVVALMREDLDALEAAERQTLNLLLADLERLR